MKRVIVVGMGTKRGLCHGPGSINKGVQVPTKLSSFELQKAKEVSVGMRSNAAESAKEES